MRQEFTTNTRNYKQEFESSKAWGLLTSVDVRDCDPKLIRSADAIREFVVKLCELIEMKRFGETVVVHFGESEVVAGYSMTQLIETSLISGHFANLTNNAYLDIFSCKYYEPQVVAEFAKNFFKGNSYDMNVALRK